MSFLHAAVIKMKTDCVLFNIGIPTVSNGSPFFFFFLPLSNALFNKMNWRNLQSVIFFDVKGNIMKFAIS
jgi:hypothetical protein